MATHGARRLLEMTANAANIIGIELLAAVQGCEFHAPIRSSTRLERVRALLRRDVPALADDRHLAPDMAAATALVRSGAVAQAAGSDVLPDFTTRIEGRLPA